MNQFKNISFLIIAIFIAGNALAQKKNGRGWDERKERYKAEKVAFITNGLDLKVAEAQKFWPVYNEYSSEREKVHDRRHELVRKCRNFDDITEKEAANINKEFAELAKKDADILEKYRIKFEKVLSAKRTLRLFMLEHEFKNHLLKKIGRRGHYGKKVH